MAASNARTAIVTGAGKRVGAAISEALIADGWTVLAHVHREEDPVPAGTLKVAADLAQDDCAERIFAAASDLPPVRLLVNNAARFAWDGIEAFSPAELRQHMAINVSAPALLIDALARAHSDSADALVVNILDSKLRAPNPDYLSYTLSKQALEGLTELAARALAAAGIRVNGIAPALMLVGLIPDHLKVRSARILLENYEVQADIGFHEFEVGAPQRLLVSVEVWLASHELPANDDPESAWNYDFLRLEVARIASERRYNLQETLAHVIFERVASFHGVRALRVRTSKPDVYADADGVGVEIASFSESWPRV
jgi:dihydroneopterin aldolase